MGRSAALNCAWSQERTESHENHCGGRDDRRGALIARLIWCCRPAGLHVVEIAVEAPDVDQEVLGQALAFALDGTGRSDPPEQHGRPVSPQPHGGAARDQLPEQDVEAAQRRVRNAPRSR